MKTAFILIHLSIVTLLLSLVTYRFALPKIYGTLDQRIIFIWICYLILLILSKFKLIRQITIIATLTLLLLEISLRILATTEVLPFHFYQHTPYSMNYTPHEGGLHSSMNRYGWHDINQPIKENTKKIAIIGDSYIQAYNIAPKQQMGQHLRAHLNKDYQVFQFGISGVGPARYLEILKYAKQYYNIDSAIISICINNDFRNLIHELDNLTTTSELYYVKNPDTNSYQLHPQSAIQNIDWHFERMKNHFPLFPNLIRIVNNNLYTKNIIRSIIFMKSYKKQQQEKNEKVNNFTFGDGADQIIFKTNQNEYKNQMIDLMRFTLSQILTYAKKNDIQIRFFDQPYYTKKLDLLEKEGKQYSYKEPQRILKKLSYELGFHYTPTLEVFLKNNIIDDLSTLYNGHYNEKGHAFAGQVLWKYVCEEGKWPLSQIKNLNSSKQ